VQHQVDRELVKPAEHTTVDTCEQEPTTQPTPSREDEALERLLLRYLKIYKIAQT
jgi:hypothetical protein